MKNIVTNLNQLMTILILLGAVTSIGLANIPFVMAAPDPSGGGDTSIPADSSTLQTITEADPNVGIITTVKEVRMYNEAKVDPDAASTSGCPLANPGGAVDTPVWSLRDTTDNSKKIGFIFDGNGAGNADDGKATIEFGTIPGNPVDVVVNLEGQITSSGVAVGIKGVDLLNGGTWREIDGAGVLVVAGAAPNTGTGAGLPRAMSMLFCGEEGTILPASFKAGHQFVILAPVGGITLPISTTALLIAGVSNSAFWLLPLVVIAGGAFALLKVQIHRNED